MRNTILTLVLFSILFLVPSVSAEIFLNQPENVYNLGDEMIIDASVNELSDGYFTMEMLCGSEKIVLFKDILNSLIIKKQFPLTKIYIGSLVGDCNLIAYYGGSVSQTQDFVITDKVEAFLEISDNEFNPNDNVLLKLSATKANGKPLNGFANIIFDAANISLTKAVKNGKFETNFSIPNNLAAGTYSIKTSIYEKDKQDLITNNVFLENNFFVKQEARKLEVAISSQEAIPGKDYVFKINVYDQVNSSIETQVKFSVLNDNGDVLLERLADSNKDINLNFAFNETPGSRSLVAEIIDSGFKSKRFFYVPRVEKVDFEIINSTVKIINVGNVPYKKSVEIGLAGKTEIIDVELGVAKSARFGLHAPEGEYDIKLTDGREKFSAKSVSLTGNAIKIVDIDNSASGNLLNRYPFVWVFVIGVLGLFIFGIAKSLGKAKFMIRGSSDSPTSKKGIKGFADGSSREQGVEVLKTSSGSLKKSRGIKTVPLSSLKHESFSVSEAEHSLVLRGQKEEGTILAIKIKNYKDVKKSSQSLDSLASVMKLINEVKGVIYEIDDYVFGIFTPSVTKSFRNELSAIKVGRKIVQELDAHNKKFVEKIDFGIGVNSGYLIVKPDKKSGKLKFTSLGHTVSLAKKVSGFANSEVLLSEAARSNSLSEVKTNKHKAGGLNIYTVSSITDRAQHQKFIHGFLERQKKE